MTNLLRITVALIVTFGLGCGTDAVVLPADFNKKVTKKVVIDYAIELGDVTNLSGVHGGPRSPIESDTLLKDAFQYAQIDTIRLPQGYLCDYTLGGIFPDASKDPSDIANYDFSAIDNVMEAAHKVGARLVWQAIYDIGVCTVKDGVQTGSRPVDLAKWLTVVTNVLRHFNGDALVENRVNPTENEKVWSKDARKFQVSHVEFIDDPMGRGGYSNVDDVVSDFLAFSAAVKDSTVFRTYVTGHSFIYTVGPSMTITDAASVSSHPLLAFVDALVAQGKLDSLDVISYQTEVDTPQENALIAQAVNSALKERKVDKPVWVTRYQPSQTVVKTMLDNGQWETWSTYAGAFATASKIGWQGLVDRAMFYRGDRRFLDVGGNDITNVEHSPLWSPKAELRPAGISWLPWPFFTPSMADLPDKVRIHVDDMPVEDRSGLSIIAAKCPPLGALKSQLKDLKDPPEPCADRMWLLIANANVAQGQKSVSYQIQIDNVGTENRTPTQGIVRHSVINESTEDFRFITERPEIVTNRRLKYTIKSSVPATDFVEIEWVFPGAN